MKKLFVLFLVLTTLSLLIAGCGEKKQYSGTCFKDTVTTATICKVTETGKEKQCPSEFTFRQCLIFLSADCQNVVFTEDKFTMEC